MAGWLLAELAELALLLMPALLGRRSRLLLVLVLRLHGAANQGRPSVKGTIRGQITADSLRRVSLNTQGKAADQISENRTKT